VFSMVVFSCIVNEGYVNIGSERLLCVFNNNADACNYGVTVGVASFLGSIGFLLLDWQATSPEELPLAQGSDAARATIAFCFFSIVTWAVLTLSALRRYLSGANMTLFTWQHMDHAPGGNARATPYPIANGATILFLFLSASIHFLSPQWGERQVESNDRVLRLSSTLLSISCVVTETGSSPGGGLILCFMFRPETGDTDWPR
ncbi:hypothetical protein CRUP_008765, partial [Coryphaenoides rupestris]